MEERLVDPVGTPSGGGRVVRRRAPEPAAPVPDDDPVAARDDHAPGSSPDDDPIAVPRRSLRTGRGPITGALAPHVGALAVGGVVLAIAVVGLLIALVGSTQPSILGTSDPAVVDTFGGTDGSPLGDVPTGGTWDTVGSWQVVAGTAFLAQAPDGGGRGYALLPGSGGTVRIAATLYGLADDGGIVARYQGPDDHIALTPVEGLGTWRIDVFAGGEAVASEALGLIGVEEGMRIELVVRGDNAWAIIDGQVRGRVDVSQAPSEGRVGLVAGLQEGGSTRFDDVARERS